jgi:hypothetical protein
MNHQKQRDIYLRLAQQHVREMAKQVETLRQSLDIALPHSDETFGDNCTTFWEIYGAAVQAETVNEGIIGAAQLQQSLLQAASAAAWQAANECEGG